MTAEIIGGSGVGRERAGAGKWRDMTLGDMTSGGIAGSAALHLIVLALILLGLPNLFRKPPLDEQPIAVRLVTIAEGEAASREGFDRLDEFVPVAGFPELAHESFRRCSSANVVVVGGAMADEIERVLRPILEEDAAASLNPVLPLVRIDDPTLEDLVSLERWAYFLLGRALGLPPFRAREFMEECFGYQNENQISE